MQTEIQRSEPDEADYVWLRMAARYPASWAKYMGPVAAGVAAAEWREQITGLTHTQIIDGFARDAKRASPFPPSAPQFAALCRGEPKARADDVVRTYESGHYYVPREKRLKSDRSRAVAARHISDICRKLGIDAKATS